MINKLHQHFQNSMISDSLPHPLLDSVLWLREKKGTQWLGIPKEELQEGQYELLKSLFEIVENNWQHGKSETAKAWLEYLFSDGPLPRSVTDNTRIIQIYTKSSFDSNEFCCALEAFFQGATVIWIDRQHAVIVEAADFLFNAEEELYSIATALENDFYVKTFLFAGKVHKHSPSLKSLFLLERDLFHTALRHHPDERVFSLEKAVPAAVADNLPQGLKQIVSGIFTNIFEEDPEMRKTLLVFLQSGSNVSLAAKKLYIHRNTLQYRLEKFSDRTGISLKDFNSSFTIYLGCLLVR
ncbi:PucR family transcriptional regulator [Bacillus massilinigeriensis]|uniref:PucR family transcriptional regulator n=1 Tax=Bacillus mediterraneensis TaxID=1805474 RepID=UPI0008F82D1B|nr:helix-turn-helix domain-containing protein [Bacillus mediterraneensis]